MEDLLKSVKSKRLIFTATSGRSGTKYLSYLLGLLKDTYSEHEGIPGFHEYFRKIQCGKYNYTKFWIEKKLPFISTVKETNYSDLSHVACKGFFESLLELGFKPSLIILRRDSREVAKSLMQLKTIPGRTELGKIWLNAPYDNNVLKLNVDHNLLSDYQMCYWYTKEIERRQEHYKNLFNALGCLVSDITLKELAKGSGIYKIIKDLSLNGFGIKNKIKFVKNRSKIINQKLSNKNVIISIDYDSEELQLNSYLESYE